MNRESYKVFATQIVKSEQNPQGVLSDISGYPKPFDSRNYNATEANPNGDRDIALYAAQAELKSQAVVLSTANNPNRAGWAVYIIRTSDGERLDRVAWGGYPDMTPAPEPEPEEQGEGE